MRDLKAYDILLPLNVLIKISFIDETLEWWNEVIAGIDINNEICELTEKFYQKIINDNEKGYLDNNLYFQYRFSIARIESFVWQTCFEYFENIYNDDKKFGLCLFTSGLYASRITKSFWEKLDKKVYPKLLKECQKLSETNQYNYLEIALIKRTVFIYCSELGSFYYNILYNMINPFILISKTELEENCSKYLIQTLETATNKIKNADFYISKNFIYQLYDLDKYSEKFAFNDFSCKCLGLCLPVLLQCIGDYSQATKKL